MEIPVQLQTNNFSIKTLQIDQVYFDSATIQDEKFEQNKELDENYNHTNNDDVESNKQRKNSILSVLNNAFHNPLTSSTGGYKQTGDDRENSRKNSVLYTFHPSNPLTSSSNGKHRNNSAIITDDPLRYSYLSRPTDLSTRLNNEESPLSSQKQNFTFLSSVSPIPETTNASTNLSTNTYKSPIISSKSSTPRIDLESVLNDKGTSVLTADGHALKQYSSFGLQTAKEGGFVKRSIFLNQDKTLSPSATSSTNTSNIKPTSTVSETVYEDDRLSIAPIKNNPFLKLNTNTNSNNNATTAVSHNRNGPGKDMIFNSPVTNKSPIVPPSSSSNTMTNTNNTNTTSSLKIDTYGSPIINSNSTNTSYINSTSNIKINIIDE